MILSCLLEHCNMMISKSQYTHLLRACRFVVRRFHPYNVAQRTAMTQANHHIICLKLVSSGDELDFIPVCAATASSMWKNILREPIANIT